VKCSGNNYGVGDAVAGDSVVAEPVVVSDDAVAVGLADGATVSVLCPQAASRPAVRRMQTHFFMRRFVGEKNVEVNSNFWIRALFSSSFQPRLHVR
jgi:hypothetical protein